MREHINVTSFQTKQLNTFSGDVLIGFGAICLYIDELCRRSGSGIVKARRHPEGSESWGLPWAGENESPVLIKALPWDERISELASLVSCPEGVAVMLRNEYLTAPDMQTLWEELGKAYLPSPTNDLYAPAHMLKDKPFQLIIFCLGPGCDLPSLTNSTVQQAAERVREIYPDLEFPADLLHRTPERHDLPEGRPVGLNHDRLAGILAGIANRVVRYSIA